MQENHEIHDHHESHEHHHENHDHSSKETPVSREELLALLSYMVSHNQHHAEELSELAKQADGTAREALTKAISLFDEGNKQLELALDEMKKHA
ncbi:MAG: cobalt transporter [Lachnospiraceae bacterium]|nr:cobalt transporter [Lachnospiraceae bacterium]MBR6149839.1 cobalt transporter [Lachnospiraceae bacterium]